MPSGRKISRLNTESFCYRLLVNGIKKLLNENAAIELSKIKIDFSEKKKRAPKRTKCKQEEPLEKDIPKHVESSEGVSPILQ